MEVIGLPLPQENESDEDLLVECFSELGLDFELTNEDIDICHEVPSRRKDKKRVVICKFMSCKSKLAVIQAKKNQRRNLKFRNNQLYINEHLSQQNRSLFASASDIKREFKFKFLWTKNGSIYLRKNDNSEIIHVLNDKTIHEIRMREGRAIPAIASEVTPPAIDLTPTVNMSPTPTNDAARGVSNTSEVVPKTPVVANNTLNN